MTFHPTNKKPYTGKGAGSFQSENNAIRCKNTTSHTKAEAIRTSADLNKLLPLGMLCELRFPGGEWIGVSHSERAFAADTAKETWVDLETGGSGVGSISLAANVFSISEEEAARRMSLWASSMLTVCSDGSVEIGGDR